jgi:glycosyltransferase involved in cell wall biosynthesis
MTRQRDPLHVLVLHGDLMSRMYESSEVWQVVTALLRSAGRPLRISVTDCRRVYDAVLQGERAECGAGRRLNPAEHFDAVHIFGPLPLRHVLIALLLRARRIPVVFTPMSLLADDFTQTSWYRRTPGLYRRLKPHLVAAVARLWDVAASAVVFASDHERRQTPIRRPVPVLMPWPWPDTPLADTIVEQPELPPVRREGPVALVSRPDAWRKGFDRIRRWLERYADELPRPAVMVFTAEDDASREALADLERQGLVVWDRTSTGSALRQGLATCRGAVLLSRWEGQPRALREALLLGLPTLTTASANLQEVVRVVGAGAVVDGDDPDEIHRAFTELAGHDPDQEATRRLFDPAVQGPFLSAVYAALASGQPIARPDLYELVSPSRGGERIA